MDSVSFRSKVAARAAGSAGESRLSAANAKRAENTKALYHFNKALEGDLPSELRGAVYRQQGLIYGNMKRDAEAARVLEKALASRGVTSAERAKILENLGLVYMELGDYEQAAERFGRAVDMGRAGWRVHYNIGLALYKLERWEEATAQFQAALGSKRIPPAEKAAIYESLGFARMRLERYEEAAGDFRSAIDAGRDGGKVRQNLGFALYRSRLWDEALEQFLLSLEHERTALTLTYVGRCYKELNKPGMAVHYLRKAMEAG